MALDRERVLADLSELRRLDPDFALFGAADHRYVLNEPLSERRVAAFEKKYEAALPEEYRRFLTELGDGGAGPWYGVFRLGEMDDGFGFEKWRERGHFVGDLSEPFPLARRWNVRPKLPDVDADDPTFDAAMEEYDKRYWNTANVNGAVPICNLGCCIRHWLVVTGREAGNVWVDERTDEGGLYRFAKLLKRRMTFAEWYDDWLKKALRQARRSR